MQGSQSEHRISMCVLFNSMCLMNGNVKTNHTVQFHPVINLIQLTVLFYLKQSISLGLQHSKILQLTTASLDSYCINAILLTFSSKWILHMLFLCMSVLDCLHNLSEIF